MSVLTQPEYLQPYLSAVRRHGAGFGSLLWASPQTQAARFDALTRLCEFAGRTILDVGCGRADLLDYLLSRGIEPEHYVGLEAVDALAKSAEQKRRPRSTIVRADFVAEPARLFTGADVIVFSGSLNTLEPHAFYSSLRSAWQATAVELAFNFLTSRQRAATPYLFWHRPAAVMHFVREFGDEVAVLDDYLEGDCTIRICKQGCSGRPPHPNPLPRSTGGEGTKDG